MVWGLMRISHISVSDKITLLVYGCNFKCKYCFFKPRDCTNLTTKSLYDILSKIKKECNLSEILIAGGEPTLQDDLPKLTKLLNRNFHSILSTNGSYLLETIDKLRVKEVHVNLKAFDNKKHRLLTSQSNKRVLEAIEYLGENKRDLNFKVEISTVLIPGIIGLSEIEKIAKFLGRWDLPYHIIAHVPTRLNAPRPSKDIIDAAKNISQKYLSNVSTSLESRRHRKGKKILIQKSLIIKV
ncbi:MAG: Radical SAM domain protein [Methanobacteriaceae archaeon 41_258]|nr:MAG: Radical SAM domain protein [Methanobacteriaceae archaeon 41_258]